MLCNAALVEDTLALDRKTVRSMKYRYEEVCTNVKSQQKVSSPWHVTPFSHRRSLCWESSEDGGRTKCLRHMFESIYMGLGVIIQIVKL